jgi:hypothetical protein
MLVSVVLHARGQFKYCGAVLCLFALTWLYELLSWRLPLFSLQLGEQLS